MSDKVPVVRGFWTWLVCADKDGGRGLHNLANIWTAVAFVGTAAFAFLSRSDPSELASKIALPAAAVLVGLSFAWAGRSSSLLQDKDFADFIIEHGPPAEGYIYSFQLAILAVILFVSVALIVGAGGVGITTSDSYFDRSVNRFLVIFLGFISLRECWGVIYFANKLSLQFYEIRRIKGQAQKQEGTA